MACSRRQIVESGASRGFEGNGRRSSRSYRSRLKRGVNGAITNCANSVAKGALVGRLRRIAASDRLEVLGRTPGHVEHVGRRRPELECTELVIIDVVANVAD